MLKYKEHNIQLNIGQSVAYGTLSYIIAVLQPGITLEIEGSIQNIHIGHFTTIKKLKRAPLI